MSYLYFLLSLCVVLGLVGVASNPSPFFGAVGLVLAAGCSCGVLVLLGSSFVSLVLFLVYLGGMLVVFAYSVALAAEPFPETWLDFSVGSYLIGYVGFVFFMGVLVGGLTSFGGLGVVGVDGGGLFCVRSDMSGVVLFYMIGGGLLVLSGVCLVLALFVVLELTRGLSRGSLRVV
uniref:NADH-ubiquinone oxidoreductase chain 6 n=1 Tax=Aprasia parapulchella TaxID=207572 RepID=A0A067Z771_9SAUR|nr:NADH dehydrogenase subunit 6 [Aprasia parapulchella]AHL17034.1 NADH dehydrogenase subunit 6 [Aprasia parapulchella]